MRNTFNFELTNSLVDFNVFVGTSHDDSNPRAAFEKNGKEDSFLLKGSTNNIKDFKREEYLVIKIPKTGQHIGAQITFTNEITTDHISYSFEPDGTQVLKVKIKDANKSDLLTPPAGHVCDPRQGPCTD